VHLYGGESPSYPNAAYYKKPDLKIDDNRVSVKCDLDEQLIVQLQGAVWVHVQRDHNFIRQSRASGNTEWPGWANSRGDSGIALTGFPLLPESVCPLCRSC
jgi:hypothetical protein